MNALLHLLSNIAEKTDKTGLCSNLACMQTVFGCKTSRRSQAFLRLPYAITSARIQLCLATPRSWTVLAGTVLQSRLWPSLAG